jgi:hypothetical protein
MIPEGRYDGGGRRAALAALAFTVMALIIYALFSSGFGRIPRPAEELPVPVALVTTPAAPKAARPAGVLPAVVSDRFWLTYLPQGLQRTGGGAIEREPGVAGEWARFGSADRFVEARVEHGVVAADWRRYRARVSVLDARDTVVRGRPAVAGRHPGGGRVIAWLERAGTGAWIRVGEPLGGELLAVAASVQAPVGD